MPANYILELLIIFVVSYLLGSITFAIIVSKVFYKKDIRQFGSGNAGMTNILRTFGVKAAAMTVAGDFFKGVASVVFARLVFANIPVAAEEKFIEIFNKQMVLIGFTAAEAAIYLAVLGSFLGHLYPIYFGFKGGKGVSVIAGSMIGATPVTLFCAFLVFVFVVVTSKIVSLASIAASVSYFFITLIYFYITGDISVLNLIAAIGFPTLIVYAHRANLKRLLKGTEYKFGTKK